jgi:competence protein ComEA
VIRQQHCVYGKTPFKERNSNMKFLQFFFMIIALTFGSVLPASAAGPEGAEPAAKAVQAAKININTASASELAAGIKGVGKKKAQLIVEFREKYGSFATIEELAQVKGIGKGTVQANAGKLTVE